MLQKHYNCLCVNFWNVGCWNDSKTRTVHEWRVHATESPGSRNSSPPPCLKELRAPKSKNRLGSSSRSSRCSLWILGRQLIDSKLHHTAASGKWARFWDSRLSNWHLRIEIITVGGHSNYNCWGTLKGNWNLRPSNIIFLTTPIRGIY